MRKLTSALVLIFVCFAFSATARGEATFTGLGDLPGGSFESFPEGISADGQVVVGYSVSAAGYEAFRWTWDEGMVSLGATTGDASGASADGSVIVGNALFGTANYEAFRWTAATGVVRVEGLGGAEGVSADGLVVVGDRGTPSGWEAALWTAGTGVVGLGDLAGGDFGSHAHAASGDGSVVVGQGTIDAAWSWEAFRWTADTGMVGLGNLGEASYAFDVSSDGSVVVGASFGPENSLEAFRWTAAEGMVSLGDVPGGFVISEARGVSADGSVIVGACTPESGPEACIWEAATGFREIDRVLTDDFGLDLSGWTLVEAWDVSADGRTIVGQGINPSGESEGWIAIISRPATGLHMADDFEADFGNWSNVGGDDIDWTRNSGATPSSRTGPSVDHTTGTDSGSYLYTESSSYNTTPPGNPEKTAILESPCLDLSGMSSATWNFWYHMWGQAMGELNAEVAAGCGSTWETVFSVDGDQGDAWIEADVDLAAYVGTSVQLRFRGVTGSSYTSDMAIDDVVITAEPVETCTVDSQCDDGLACTDDSCDVGGTCLHVDTCPTGEVCSASAGMCVRECESYIDCDDEDPCTEDLCSDGICEYIADPALCVASYPAADDFETGFGRWNNVEGDDIDWTRDSGGTPSSGTGPSVDHTTGSASGYYLYTESSRYGTTPPGNPEKTAILESPCFDLSGMSSATWTFWYHMRGSAMGHLYAEAAPDCSTTWETSFSVSGDQGNDWIQGQVDLGVYVGTRIRLRFRAVTGRSYTSDMAIDDVLVDAAP